MPSFRKYVGGKFLTAKSLGKRKIVGKIVNVTPEILKGRDGKESEKLCLQIEDETKLVQLNSGNLNRLGDHWGDDYDDWVGRPVIVTTSPTTYNGEECLGLVVNPLKDGKKK